MRGGDELGDDSQPSITTEDEDQEMLEEILELEDAFAASNARDYYDDTDEDDRGLVMLSRARKINLVVQHHNIIKGLERGDLIWDTLLQEYLSGTNKQHTFGD